MRPLRNCAHDHGLAAGVLRFWLDRPKFLASGPRTLDTADFLRLLEGMKRELAQSHGIQDVALTHFLCFLWYPLKNKHYWWCTLLILRPTVIAFFYNLRDRGTGLVEKTVDWRVLVICFLMCYNTLQAIVKPFKLPHESMLDSVAVLLLMMIFVVHLNIDVVVDVLGIESDDARATILTRVFLGAAIVRSPGCPAGVHA